MEYKVSNLSVFAYGKGATLWHYGTRENTLAECLTENYLCEASDMLKKHDVIIISATDGVTQVYVKEVSHNHIILSNMKFLSQ